MLKLKLQYFGHLIQRADSLEKTLMLGKVKGKRKRVAEDEMVGWHHPLEWQESEQTPGDSEGQGSLECGSPRRGGVRHDLTTEQQHLLELILRWEQYTN